MNIHHFGLHNRIWKDEKLYELYDTDQLYNIIFKMTFKMAIVGLKTEKVDLQCWFPCSDISSFTIRRDKSSSRHCMIPRLKFKTMQSRDWTFMMQGKTKSI